MTRIVLFIIYIFIFLARVEISFAEEKKPQTLEEITAELEAKKAELEPFKDEDVKIDVESLGLDDLDKKSENSSKKTKAIEVVKGVKEKDLPAIENDNLVEENKVKEEISNKIPVIQEEKSEEEIVEESDNLKQKETNKEEQQEDEEAQKKLTPVQKFIKKQREQENNAKKSKEEKVVEVAKIEDEKAKQNILEIEIKKKEEEKIKAANEEKRRKKLEKLNELRQKYLTDSSSGLNYLGEKIVVPRKKEINPFIVDELPALPILNRFRTKDNTHIPIIPTPKERVRILFDAIKSGKVDFFNSAYDYVKNPNARNIQGDTILTYSVLLQKHAILASILAKGADPNMENSLGYTPTTIAIEMLDFESLDLLVNNGADINFTDKFDRNYLMHSARVGFLPAVEFFVTKGIDVNAMDIDGFTALSIAYRHKKEVIVKYLLKNGAKTWVEKPYKPEEQNLIRELQNRWNNK